MTDTSYLDTKAVDAWLNAHLEGYQGPSEAQKFAGGQSNPTFQIAHKAGPCAGRKPPGVLLKSAHAVDREFRSKVR